VRSWLLVAVATLPFTIGHRLLPHDHSRELGWAWWQHILGNSYLFAALLLVGWSATRAGHRVRAGGNVPFAAATSEAWDLRGVAVETGAG
jgi:hypothetical protein